LRGGAEGFLGREKDLGKRKWSVPAGGPDESIKEEKPQKKYAFFLTKVGGQKRLKS